MERFHTANASGTNLIPIGKLRSCMVCGVAKKIWEKKKKSSSIFKNKRAVGERLYHILLTLSNSYKGQLVKCYGVCVCVCVCASHLVMSNSLRPHGL